VQASGKEDYGPPVSAVTGKLILRDFEIYYPTPTPDSSRTQSSPPGEERFKGLFLTKVKTST
jgi:hypothetical protein